MAFLVNEKAIISVGLTFCVSISQAILSIRTLVFPLPAPARTRARGEVVWWRLLLLKVKIHSRTAYQLSGISSGAWQVETTTWISAPLYFSRDSTSRPESSSALSCRSTFALRA